MTAINSVLNLSTALTQDQIDANNEVDAEQNLTQEDFFALLAQQLAYQDPFEPTDNAEMISQMSSFTTAEGITTMGEAFSDMKEILTSSQALEASSLVGKKVLIPSDQGYLAETGELSAAISSDTGAYGVLVTVENSNGEVVRTINLGDIGAGNKRFSWDGLDNDGNRLEEDIYTLKANGTVDGQGEELTVATYAHVDSVSLGGGEAGVTLNLQGLGGIKLSDAIEVAGN